MDPCVAALRVIRYGVPCQDRAPPSITAPVHSTCFVVAPQYRRSSLRLLAVGTGVGHTTDGSGAAACAGNHARGTGALQIYNLKGGELEMVKEKEKKDAIKCGTFGHSTLAERTLATGDFKGMLEIWDLERLETPTYSAKAHNSIVNCCDGCGGTVGAGAAEIVTGSRDGCVRVWDPRQKDVPVAALEPGEGEPARDCWSVSFGNAHSVEDRCVVAGFDNGDVKLWDLRTNEIRWETCVGNGVCGVEFDRLDIPMNKMVAT
jgi:WD40 repeat protein